LTDGVDRQSAELIRQRPMLLLVEVLVANEHDLMLCDQLAEMLDVAACEWDRQVESVDDGADRAGETVDGETAGRRGCHAVIVTDATRTHIGRSTRSRRRSDDRLFVLSADHNSCSAPRTLME
jgi:hypothetical protein